MRKIFNLVFHKIFLNYYYYYILIKISIKIMRIHQLIAVNKFSTLFKESAIPFHSYTSATTLFFPLFSSSLFPFIFFFSFSHKHTGTFFLPLFLRHINTPSFFSIHPFLTLLLPFFFFYTYPFLSLSTSSLSRTQFFQPTLISFHISPVFPYSLSIFVLLLGQIKKKKI